MEKSCWHARTSMVRTSGTMGEHHAGCSKRPSSKAAASEEARHTLRYVEPLSAARTKLADFFSILLDERHGHTGLSKPDRHLHPSPSWSHRRQCWRDACYARLAVAGG